MIYEDKEALVSPPSRINKFSLSLSQVTRDPGCDVLPLNLSYNRFSADEIELALKKLKPKFIISST